jgi:hypothetical protein
MGGAWAMGAISCVIDRVGQGSQYIDFDERILDLRSSCEDIISRKSHSTYVARVSLQIPSLHRPCQLKSGGLCGNSPRLSPHGGWKAALRQCKVMQDETLYSSLYLPRTWLFTHMRPAERFSAVFRYYRQASRLWTLPMSTTYR